MNVKSRGNLVIGGLAAGALLWLAQSCAPRPPYRAPAPLPPTAPSVAKPAPPISPPPAQETVRKPLPQESKIKEQELKSKPLPPALASKEAPKEPNIPSEPAAPALPDDSSLLAKITPGTSPQRAASLRLTEEGRKLLDAGDAAKAVTRLEKTIVIDSTNPYGYFYLAKAQYRLRQYKDSLNFLDVAESRLSAEPFWLAEVQALRGENYRALGMTQKAEASYEQALRLNSGNRTALDALSRLHETQPASR
jgi:tetratricopeptide (TPR) repeat protein